MVRHAAAVAVVVFLSPAWLCAQTDEFTVQAQSATVHRSPSTGSLVIGRAPRGTVLEVTRDIGSWVKVVWPEAPDGVGYVHETMGSLVRRATRVEQPAAPSAAPPVAAAPPIQQPHMAPSAVPAPSSDGDVSPSTRATYIAPPTHLVGLGGRMGGAPLGELGATARVWSHSRLGVQVEASRSSVTSEVAPGRVTSFQLAPSVIYSFRDYVSDNVWVRPYVGGGATVYRSSLKLGTPDIDPVPDTTVGYRGFGGAEVTFPAVPRFAISADVGRLWMDTPYEGFDLGGLAVSVSGHWYVK